METDPISKLTDINTNDLVKDYLNKEREKNGEPRLTSCTTYDDGKREFTNNDNTVKIELSKDQFEELVSKIKQEMAMTPEKRKEEITNILIQINALATKLDNIYHSEGLSATLLDKHAKQLFTPNPNNEGDILTPEDLKRKIEDVDRYRKLVDGNINEINEEFKKLLVYDIKPDEYNELIKSYTYLSTLNLDTTKFIVDKQASPLSNDAKALIEYQEIKDKEIEIENLKNEIQVLKNKEKELSPKFTSGNDNLNQSLFNERITNAEKYNLLKSKLESKVEEFNQIKPTKDSQAEKFHREKNNVYNDNQNMWKESTLYLRGGQDKQPFPTLEEIKREYEKSKLGIALNGEAKQLQQLINQEKALLKTIQPLIEENKAIPMESLARLHDCRKLINQKYGEVNAKLSELKNFPNITNNEFNTALIGCTDFNGLTDANGKKLLLDDSNSLEKMKVEQPEIPYKIEDNKIKISQTQNPHAKAKISSNTTSNTLSLTQEEKSILDQMSKAVKNSIQGNVKSSPNNEDKSYTLTTEDKTIDLKMTATSVETKNPTNSNLKAMSTAIAANVFARITKVPPENPKVTLGDCKPPEVAQEFTKQIELALTNLKIQHPNHTDKINSVLENFKNNHSKPLNTATVTLEDQENKKQQPAPSTHTNNRF